jgi:hypothetical protein
MRPYKLVDTSPDWSGRTCLIDLDQVVAIVQPAGKVSAVRVQFAQGPVVDVFAGDTEVCRRVLDEVEKAWLGERVKRRVDR